MSFRSDYLSSSNPPFIPPIVPRPSSALPTRQEILDARMREIQANNLADASHRRTSLVINASNPLTTPTVVLTSSTVSSQPAVAILVNGCSASRRASRTMINAIQQYHIQELEAAGHVQHQIFLQQLEHDRRAELLRQQQLLNQQPSAPSNDRAGWAQSSADRRR